MTRCWCSLHFSSRAAFEHYARRADSEEQGSCLAAFNHGKGNAQVGRLTGA